MKTKLIVSVTAALLSLLFSAGCAPGRIADLQDSVRISAGYGPGFGVEGSLGILGSPSIGLAAAKHMFGFEGRDCSIEWREVEAFFPAVVVLFYPSNSGTQPKDRFFAPYARYMLKRSRAADRGKPPHRHGPTDRNEDVRMRNLAWAPTHQDVPMETSFAMATDWEAGAAIGIISPRLGCNPIEFADCLLGFIGLDIAGDDSNAELHVSVRDIAEHKNDLAKLEEWIDSIMENKKRELERIATWKAMGEIVVPILAQYLKERPYRFQFPSDDDETVVFGFSSYLRRKVPSEEEILRNRKGRLHDVLGHHVVIVDQRIEKAGQSCKRLPNGKSFKFDRKDRLCDPWGDPVVFVVDRDGDMKLTARGYSIEVPSGKGNAPTVGLLLGKPEAVLCNSHKVNLKGFSIWSLDNSPHSDEQPCP